MTFGRMHRVDEAVRQVIGDAVTADLKDPRVGFVTVTDVRTSSDLSHARVYVSVLGDPETREETMDGLRSAHGYLQRRIAEELHLKATPTLDFVYDDTTDRAMRVDAVIDAQERRSAAPEAPSGGGAEPIGGASREASAEEAERRRSR